VDDRIFHFPWPDHHPPPFALLPHVLASMRDWLWESAGSGAGRARRRRCGPDGAPHVVVVHCKAGKGRSGTAACAYLIAEEGWARADALARFTARRMRPGWGPGVSIPSQLRWLAYVERWVRCGRVYAERKVEVLEVRVEGLRDGVRVNVDGFVDDGKTIRTWHSFAADERTIVRGAIKVTGFADAAVELFGELNGSRAASRNSSRSNLAKANHSAAGSDDAGSGSLHGNGKSKSSDNGPSMLPELTEYPEQLLAGEATGADAIFKPKEPIIVTTNDICIDLERRTKGAYTWAVPTSVAHVWFNAFFEGSGPERNGAAADEGVFEVAWDDMDGLKGSNRKGTRACDRVAVVWRAVESTEVLHGPQVGDPVRQSAPADWRDAAAASDDEDDEGTQAFGVESPAAMD